jgi:hypothetical protein
MGILASRSRLHWPGRYRRKNRASQRDWSFGLETRARADAPGFKTLVEGGWDALFFAYMEKQEPIKTRP